MTEAEAYLYHGWPIDIEGRGFMLPLTGSAADWTPYRCTVCNSKSVARTDYFHRIMEAKCRICGTALEYPKQIKLKARDVVAGWPKPKSTIVLSSHERLHPAYHERQARMLNHYRELWRNPERYILYFNGYNLRLIDTKGVQLIQREKSA